MDFTGFGEILFDVFGETETLGGAPLNVASHIGLLGGSGNIVSAVGNDALGRRALAEIAKRNVSVERVAVLDGVPTGIANIRMERKDADYSFNEPCAWDRIAYDGSVDSDVFYFGSLAQRSRGNRNLLRRLLDTTGARYVFFDVNLRKEFYSREILEEGCRACNILKLNEDELDVFARIFSLEEEDDGNRLAELSRRFSIPIVLLTKGRYGAFCLSDGNLLHHPVRDVAVVDTVGAGDGFSAGFLFSLVETGDLEDALSLGSAIADFVVSRQGAVPYYDASMFEDARKGRILS
jgi:fructokinase